MRLAIAAILGGIAMFIWASIAHVATPLASAGLSPLPGGVATSEQLHQLLGDKSALYFFPYVKDTGSASMTAQEAAMKVESSGLLAYQGPGANAFPRQLGVEFVVEVIESLLLAVILVGAPGFGPKMRLALAVGLIAAVTTNLSYWNWYGFSPAYTVANGFTELLKYLAAGAIVAWWLGRNDRMARALTDARLGGG